MISTTDHTPQAGASSTQEVVDAAWLSSLDWRNSAPRRLVQAAGQTDAGEFASRLQRHLKRSARSALRRGDRGLQQLRAHWIFGPSSGSSDEESGLAACLFEPDLHPDELSGRVETILAGRGAALIHDADLTAAFWLLTLMPGQIEQQTLLSVWRLALESVRAQLENETNGEAPDSATLSRAEWRLYLAGVFADLKQSRRQLREATQSVRSLLQSLPKGPALPPARWLNHLSSTVGSLGRMVLFSEFFGHQLVDGKSRRALVRLLQQTASLVTRRTVGFQTEPPDRLRASLLSLEELLGGVDSLGIGLLLGGQPGRHRRESEISLPKECQQSDSAEWARLRSRWEEPVSQCLIRHDAEVPWLEVVVDDEPLIAGRWEHRLQVDGRDISTQGKWSCSCWFADRDVAYQELEQKPEEGIQVIRQALLIREDSALIIADSIRTSAAARLDYTRRVTLTPAWDVEEDSATREMALVPVDRKFRSRVRLFPVTAPQEKVARSDESLELVDRCLQSSVSAEGGRIFMATAFEWSRRRRNDPADWVQLTVAEDGRRVPRDLASACRLRIGRAQWLLYHSLCPPHFPRTALGLHSNSETVLDRVTASGELRTLLEVEP